LTLSAKGMLVDQNKTHRLMQGAILMAARFLRADTCRRVWCLTDPDNGSFSFEGEQGYYAEDSHGIRWEKHFLALSEAWGNFLKSEPKGQQAIRYI